MKKTENGVHKIELKETINKEKKTRNILSKRASLDHVKMATDGKVTIAAADVASNSQRNSEPHQDPNSYEKMFMSVNNISHHGSSTVDKNKLNYPHQSGKHLNDPHYPNIQKNHHYE